MATETYEVAVAMVVEVARVRVEIDPDAPETLEEKLKEAAGVSIDVRAGGYTSDTFVSHQYVDGVIGWNKVD